MTASQRKPQAGVIEHGPLVRIMPWGQAVQWQLPVLMAQAQVRFAKQLHDLLLGEGVTIGHSRVHELVTEAPARLTVETATRRGSLVLATHSSLASLAEDYTEHVGRLAGQYERG